MSVPSNWALVTLRELGHWVGGSTPQKSNPAFWHNGTVCWVSPKDMKHEVIDSSEDLITSHAVDVGIAKVLPEGSLLIVTRSGILQHTVPVAVTSVEVTINQDIKALIPAPGVNAKFVAAQIRWRQIELLGLSAKAGTTVDSLDFERLKDFKILLPSTDEQARIVSRLEELRSRVIRSRLELSSIPELSLRMRSAAADLAVSGHLYTGAEASSDSDRVISKKVVEIIAEPMRTGLSIKGQSLPPGFRALRLSALRSGVVDLNDVRYLPIDADKAERFLIRKGDILVSRGSGSKSLVGLAAIVPEVSEATIFPDTAFRIRLNQDLVKPEWFVSIWNSSIIRLGLEEQSRTTAGIWKISTQIISSVTIDIPSVEEQLAVISKLDSINSRISRALAKYERAVRLLDRFEQIVFSMAFSGRLVEPLISDGEVAELVSSLQRFLNEPQKRKPRQTLMKPTFELFSALIKDWPEEGYSFEQIREKLPAPYEELKEVIFQHLSKGSFRQKFDQENQVMKFVEVIS